MLIKWGYGYVHSNHPQVKICLPCLGSFASGNRYEIHFHVEYNMQFCSSCFHIAFLKTNLLIYQKKGILVMKENEVQLEHFYTISSHFDHISIRVLSFFCDGNLLVLLGLSTSLTMFWTCFAFNLCITFASEFQEILL